jgi:hypothetical protein
MPDPQQTPARNLKREQLIEKCKLLWKLVTTTPGVVDLAEPMKRVERDFDRLTKGQRLTVAVITTSFEKGCHEIENKEAITPDEYQGAPKVQTGTGEDED